jgi:hypothetical protein
MGQLGFSPKPTPLLGSFSSVAISTPDDGQGNLNFQSSNRSTFRDETVYISCFAVYMVKLQYGKIGFAAIMTWMSRQVLIDELPGFFPHAYFSLPGAFFFFFYMALIIPALVSVLAITARRLPNSKCLVSKIEFVFLLPL